MWYKAEFLIKRRLILSEREWIASSKPLCEGAKHEETRTLFVTLFGGLNFPISVYSTIGHYVISTMEVTLLKKIKQ